MNNLIELKKKHLLLFLIYSINKKIKGIDHLLKLIYLAQKRIENLKIYDFKFEKNFVFSEELIEDLQKLVRERLIIEILSPLKRDEEEFDLIYYIPKDKEATIIKEILREKINDNILLDEIRNFSNFIRKHSQDEIDAMLLQV